MYRRLVADAPPEFTCVATLRHAPPAPWLPREIHGTPIVALFVCDTGPTDEARERAAAIKSFGTPVGNVLQPRPYLQQQALLDATQPNGRRYYWKSEFLPGVEDGLLKACMASLERMPSPHSAILIFPLDGALNALAKTTRPSAAATREPWSTSERRGTIPPTTTRTSPGRATAWDDIRPFSTGRTYVNFLNADEGDARTRDAYSANYQRLADVKRAYDPDNVFRTNKNIDPASGAGRGQG
jgi:hypothetical protein